ncbi:MAG: protease modulator HflK [Spirochaetales bacterium]|nr:protease modulator HflK [Spirochaetales bacterium]
MNDLKRVLKDSKRFVSGIIILLICAWGLSGIYSISHEEAGIVTVFGRVTDEKIEPGIHYRLPWPIGKLYRVNIKKLRIIEIGQARTGFKGQLSDDLQFKIMDYFEGSPSILYLDSRKFSKQFMTGDNNIIDVLMTVQYRVISPWDYLFSCQDPDSLIALEAERVLNFHIASSSIDRLLLRDTLMEFQMAKELQEIVDVYKIGVTIQSLFFKDVMVPEGAVEDSFRDVKSAEVDRGKRIEEAKNRSNEILAQAGSEARQIVDIARIDAERIRNTASSDYAAFIDLEKELQERAGIFNYHLWVSSMGKILGNAKTYVITDDNALGTIYIRNN